MKKVKIISDFNIEPLKKIWNNIDDWWYSLEVQSVISEFNACYTWQNPSVLCSIKENLKI